MPPGLGYPDDDPRDLIARLVRASKDVTRQGARGLAESGLATARGVDALLPFVDWEAPIRETTEQVREFYGEPESVAGKVAQPAGRLLGELAQFAVPGQALARAGRGAKLGTRLAADVPLDAAIEAGDEEGGTAGALSALAGLAGEPELQGTLGHLAGSPVGRAVVGAGTGVGVGSILESFPDIVRSFRTDEAGRLGVPSGRSTHSVEVEDVPDLLSLRERLTPSRKHPSATGPGSAFAPAFSDPYARYLTRPDEVLGGAALTGAVPVRRVEGFEDRPPVKIGLSSRRLLPAPEDMADAGFRVEQFVQDTGQEVSPLFDRVIQRGLEDPIGQGAGSDFLKVPWELEAGQISRRTAEALLRVPENTLTQQEISRFTDDMQRFSQWALAQRGIPDDQEWLVVYRGGPLWGKKGGKEAPMPASFDPFQAEMFGDDTRPFGEVPYVIHRDDLLADVEAMVGTQEAELLVRPSALRAVTLGDLGGGIYRPGKDVSSWETAQLLPVLGSDKPAGLGGVTGIVERPEKVEWHVIFQGGDGGTRELVMPNRQEALESLDRVGATYDEAATVAQGTSFRHEGDVGEEVREAFFGHQRRYAQGATELQQLIDQALARGRIEPDDDALPRLQAGSKILSGLTQGRVSHPSAPQLLASLAYTLGTRKDLVPGKSSRILGQQTPERMAQVAEAFASILRAASEGTVNP